MVCIASIQHHLVVKRRKRLNIKIKLIFLRKLKFDKFCCCMNRRGTNGNYEIIHSLKVITTIIMKSKCPIIEGRASSYSKKRSGHGTTLFYDRRRRFANECVDYSQ